ncbi:hypothetical protein HaLaN_19129, partial [Haematococcus lacustris]
MGIRASMEGALEEVVGRLEQSRLAEQGLRQENDKIAELSQGELHPAYVANGPEAEVELWDDLKDSQPDPLLNPLPQTSPGPRRYQDLRPALST